MKVYFFIPDLSFISAGLWYMEKGGAISFESYDNSISNSSFEGNSATFKGGAIYLAQSCSSTIITATDGSSNDANQCKDIYCDENGSCINFPWVKKITFLYFFYVLKCLNRKRFR